MAFAEDFGPHLSCCGTKEVWTPHLDKLAADGVRYPRFYTTSPVCSPSRSAFMTGMYQTTIGAHNHRSHRDDGYRLPDGVRLLTDWMHDAGYCTANVRYFPEAFFFRGTATQYAEAMKIIEAFEGPSAAFDGKKLQFTVEGGNAGILAEALQNAMKGMQKNPVIIQNLTGNPATLPPAAPKAPVAPAVVPMMPTIHDSLSRPGRPPTMPMGSSSSLPPAAFGVRRRRSRS